jgi:diguanylate cyclase (GGDEF)-like protein/PAS domain S-box-containing protein
MQRVGRIGALLVGAIGALVLVGWYAGVPALRTVLPGYASMKPNTAVALVAIAVAVVMMDRGRWTVSLGAFATVLGGATLLEYLLGRPLGIDVLLPGIQMGDDDPRMAPASALALLLLGLAVIAGRRGRTKAMRGLALAGFGLGHVAVLGYAYKVSSLYTVGGFTSMAVHSAVCVEMLSLSVLLLDPSGGLVSLFRNRGSAGRFARLMLPFLVLGPSVLGWLGLLAQDEGWFDTRFGVSLLVMSMTVLGLVLTWLATISMRDLDRQRDAMVHALAENNQRLEATVAERTRDLVGRQSFLDSLLETVEVGIVSCDAQGNLLVRNRAERAMVELEDAAPGSLTDSPTMNFDMLELDGRPVEFSQSPLMRALRGEDVAGVQLLLGPAGGPHREVVARGNRITGPNTEMLGAVVSLTDVTTERAVTRALEAEHSNLEEAQRLGQMGSFEYNTGASGWKFSDQLCALWGVGPGGLAPEVTQNLIHEQDRESAWQSWRQACSAGGSHSYQYRINRADDSAERLIRSTVEIGLGPDGQLQTCRGTHMDITDLTQAQHSAQEAHDFLQAVLAATPDYTFVTDLASGAVLYGSPGKDILGLTGDELAALGPDIAKLVHPEDLPRLRATNLAAADLQSGQVLQLLYRARPSNGQWQWLSRRVTPFKRDETGAVVQILGVTRDVTDVVQAEDDLRHVALHDSLTGLPNRALLVDRLDAALSRCARDGHEVAVLYCDLDGFKRVNDTAGHGAGDAVLVETARRLQEVMRPDDTVARVGGDEFVVVLEPWNRTGQGAPEENPSRGVDNVRDLALQVALRIIEVVGQPIEIDDVEHVVTASIGIAYAKDSPGGRSASLAANQLLADADAAMYRAKSRGKDRFEVFEHGLRTDLAERGRIEEVLREAVPPNGIPPHAVPASARKRGIPSLAVHYQPVFCSRTAALVSFEALARLTNADGLEIPPDAFIRVAEDVGIIRPLGTSILDLACGQLATWRAGTPGLEKATMTVNLSPLQAQHSSLGLEIRRALTAHHLSPADLVLELTETALLHAAHSTITALRALRDQGVGIAIDHFGTGHTSVPTLATLPVTAVKVDRSLVAALPQDQGSRRIINAVVTLAAEMDLTCVAVGVESEAQRNALPAGLQLQGWLTGRPQPPDNLDLLKLVTSGAPNLAHRSGPTR